MKKFIMALAIATVTLSSFTAAAKDDKKDCPKAKECTEQQCDKKDCPFDGLNLSEAQMQQIKQLGETRKAEMQKARKEAKEAKADAKKDKAASREQVKRDELAKIKAILTPEQYVQYLENLVVKGQKAGMAQRQGGDRRTQGPKGQPQSKQRPNAPRFERQAPEIQAQ